ncbi:MAG: SctK family type III secretion system sorting platform protein, partial [Kiritimatiellae bacterium]|nr:SctK family type III secretion system sorting platform protein [Kiritimatiellia bacterium]
MGDTKECELDLAAARAWVSDDARWPSIRDFLWDFAPQVHPSWLDGLTALESLPAPAVSGAPQLADLMSSPRAKAFVLSSLGIDPCFHTFPKEDGSRLLLLDSATLESLAKWLGALACADSLRKVMDGATVRALKAALPGI